MGTLSSLLVVLVSFLLAYWMRFESFAMDNSYRMVLLTGLLFSSVIFPATGAYRTEFRWDIMRRLRRLIAGWALVVITLVSSATLLKVTADYSRIWFSLWVVFCSAGLMIATLLELEMF